MVCTLGDIERLVLVDQQCVTYKWLAYEYHMPMDEAKRILGEFAQSQEKAKNTAIKVSYLLSGKTKDSDISHRVAVVSGDKLAKKRETMDSIVSLHVFSVQPRSMKDVVTAITNTNTKKLGELTTDDGEDGKQFLENKFGRIHLEKTSVGVIGKRRIVAKPEKKTETWTATKTELASAYSSMKGKKKLKSAADFFKKVSKPKAKNSYSAASKPRGKLAEKTKRRNPLKPVSCGFDSESEDEEPEEVQPKVQKTPFTASSGSQSKKSKGSSSKSAIEKEKAARKSPPKKTVETVDDTKVKKKRKVIDSDDEPDEAETTHPIHEAKETVSKKKKVTDCDTEENPKETEAKVSEDKVAVDCEGAKAGAKKRKVIDSDNEEDDDASKKVKVIDSDNDDVEMVEDKGIESDNDAPRGDEAIESEGDEVDEEAAELRKQREEIKAKEAEEKARQKELRKEAKRLAKIEDKKARENEEKLRGQERLGVVSNTNDAVKVNAEGKKVRLVKRKKEVEEHYEDDEGFLVTKTVTIEEEVEEVIPDRPTVDEKAEEKRTTQKAKKTKQGTLSMFFKKN
uniref:DNA polymerase delta subunit 3 n=1 Tax=Mucochytrium quahogii TaxID=96639 RepID=A0A7S2RTZ9_9STRA|mmetsp:Transcript_20054/g.43387  ORF Transcript_20054/g.43387 Transcript_20054/m.43387 type:complete len:567 (+) Transcript_20054:341-2041(+)